MKATCPNCGSHYDVEGAGEYECPSCGSSFEVTASPLAKKPGIKINRGGHGAQGETTHVCPWCMTKIPGTRSDDTWACPSCTHLYRVTNGTHTERIYRTFPLSNLDIGTSRKTLSVGVILLVVIVIALFILMAILPILEYSAVD